MRSTIDINKICEWCGKEFIAHKSSTRFCSHHCSGLSYKASKREKHVREQNQRTSELKTTEIISSLNYFTPRQFAILLGVGKSSVYRWLAENLISCVRLKGKTLISKEILDKMFENPSEYIKKEKPEEETISEFYTTKEVLEKFNISNGWLFKVAKAKNIPKSVVRGKTYWSRTHIDRIFKDKNLTSFDKDDWYSADEICDKFQLSKDAVYRLAYENAVRKVKEKKQVFYSKFDIDKIFKVEETLPEYYSMEEAMERFNMTRDQISYYVRSNKVPRTYEGKFVKIDRKALDAVLAGPIIVKKR